MATITAASSTIAAVSQVAKRSYRAARELPFIPFLMLAVLTFVAVFAPVIAPYSKLDPVKPTREQCLARYGLAICPYVDNVPPFWSTAGNLYTPLGTDFLGRDVLSRLMYGARFSLVVALTGTLAAGAIGTLLGVLAGDLGKWWDQIIMRITDAWLTLPSLVFAILLSSVRGPGLWNVVLILTLVFWSRYARVVRGDVLALRERDFVKLAEVNGVSRLADHPPASASQRHEHRHGGVQPASGGGRHHRGVPQLPGRGGSPAGAVLGPHDGPGAGIADGGQVVAGCLPWASASRCWCCRPTC